MNHTFEYTEDMAVNAGAVKPWIKKGGYYKGKITSAEFKPSEKTDAESFDIGFTSDDGEEAKFKFWTKKANGDIVDKNGNPLFGRNMVASLLALLNLKILNQPSEILHKRIGILIRMKANENSNTGKWYHSAEVVHFCDEKTNQTYTERKNKAMAEKFMTKVFDDELPEVVDEPIKEEETADLPF